MNEDLLTLAREIFGEIVESVEGNAEVVHSFDGSRWITFDDNFNDGRYEGMVITFTNGNRVRFTCSEWGSVEAVQ